MRRDVVCAVLGFLVGAAALAQGQDEAELKGRLQALQDAVARALHDRTVDWTGRDAGGFELGIVPVGDLILPFHEHLPPARRMTQDGKDEFPLFGNLAEEWPQPFGTIEELLELVRSQVSPESWEQYRIDFAQVEEPVRRLETEHGQLEMPVLQLTRVNASMWAPLGRTVVLGGCTVGKRTCVILATVRMLDGE